ncbi:uncharacterized protein N7518_001120 [Penicillium psychrosexuale]|uniref:uncharacterized protein n=1 Tax=Penicillium psychrosexuale TaxID=1002107 RepID=UPI00254555E0|nr:uncharacterized protein N7518_001120 [Penicillium psychrosexuale]KAJ5804817.1 hypothetical protein N7518_001120 [Penicillium psychrosexuale]
MAEAPMLLTTQGEIDFHEFIGDKWAILFSGTPRISHQCQCCTTELGAFSKLEPEFTQRGSANALDSHEEWIKDINEVAFDSTQIPNHRRCRPQNRFPLHQMIDQQDLTNVDSKGIAFTIRPVFIIDPCQEDPPDHVLPPPPLAVTQQRFSGLSTLQTADKRGVTTPINWLVGDDVIVPPTVSTEDAKKKFGEIREVKPYLRFTTLKE